MTRQQAIEELNVSLTVAIDKWSDAVAETEAWETIGYIGNDFSRLVAKGAMAVIEAYADLNEYHKQEGANLS